jgi:hypothetical protein
MLRGLLAALLILVSGHVVAGVNDVIVDKAWLHETVKGQQDVSVMLISASPNPHAYWR